MPASRYQFELPKNAKPVDYIDELIGETNFVLDGNFEFSRFFLDTFDWRLFGKGFMMVSDSLNRGFRTTWQSWDNEEVRGVLSGDRLPVFCDDFPRGKMRRILEPVLEMRALLPQAKLDCFQQRLKLLNKQKKTVLRVNFESYTIEDANRERKKLCPRIYVDAVRGYDKAFLDVVALLKDRNDLHPPANNLFLTALNKVGRHPRDYSSKLDLELEPSMRSDSAIRIVFRRLFSTLERNEEGTKQDLDSEFLHDFRVSIRRTRALLSHCKEILPNDLIDHYAGEFSWLGKATGPTRDLDVYLLNFEGYKRSLPLSIREDIEPLLEFIQAKQTKAHSELVHVLESNRYKLLKKGWRKFLAKSIEDKPPEPMAAKRIKEVADGRIWQVYDVICKKGRVIDSETPAEKLHRLRIHCKKLRYLIEFFGSLYPGKQIRHLIKSLKGLQDNLGTFQDFEVQEKTLQQYGSEMMESQASARTLLAMGVLVQELEKQRESVRREFMQRFDEFDSPRNRKLFQTLFRNGKEDSPA